MTLLALWAFGLASAAAGFAISCLLRSAGDNSRTTEAWQAGYEAYPKMHARIKPDTIKIQPRIVADKVAG